MITYMKLYFIFIIIIIIITLVKSGQSLGVEAFRGLGKPASVWRGRGNFQSAKSNLKNFNQTEVITQHRNELKPNRALDVDKNIHRSLWVYPYTFFNRRFFYILLDIINKIEKSSNKNRLNRFNKDKFDRLQYKSNSWKETPDIVKDIIYDVVGEINRFMNMDPPAVGFHREPIKYYRLNSTEMVILVKIYKRFTACDIKYSPSKWNNHLTWDFEKTLIIHVDHIRDKRNYHLNLLRIQGMGDLPDDIDYAGEHDQTFFIAKSGKNIKGVAEFSMPSSQQVAQEYRKLFTDEDRINSSKYKCFGYKSFRRVTTPTACELEDGIWDRPCEKDNDCPFYQANKNYPNDFGGCNKDTGFCKFPVGIDSQSYKTHKGTKDALCYNCKEGIVGERAIGKCCEDQKSKKEYPNLNSPDYVFRNDLTKRFNYRHLFKAKDLNWYRYD